MHIFNFLIVVCFLWFIFNHGSYNNISSNNYKPTFMFLNFIFILNDEIILHNQNAMLFHIVFVTLVCCSSFSIIEDDEYFNLDTYCCLLSCLSCSLDC